MRLTIPAIVFGLILALAGDAQAHRVSVFAYVEGGQIKGEGYMPGGGKVTNQPVQVRDAQGKVLAQGKTDRKGAFVLPLPSAKPPLTVVLEAGPGHQATFELRAADLGLSDKTQKPQAAPATPAPPSPAAAAPAGQDLAPQIQQAVERAVAPMRAQLAEMALRANQVSLRDVVGGLGWIVGLLGLAAYLKVRKLAKDARR